MTGSASGANSQSPTLIQVSAEGAPGLKFCSMSQTRACYPQGDRTSECERVNDMSAEKQMNASYLAGISVL